MSTSTDLTVFAETVAGEGIQYQLRRAWGWDVWIIVLLIVAALALTAVAYLKERGTARAGMRLALAAVRATLLLMVILLMLGWLLHRHRTDLPDLAILIDDSQSMQLADRYDNTAFLERLTERVQAVNLDSPSRINLAKTLLLEDGAKLLNSLRDNYNVKIYRIGQAARAHPLQDRSLQEAIADIQADEPASWLGRGVRDVFEAQRGRPTAAMILLTDGITTDGKTIGEVAPYARRKAVPLYIVALGDEKSPRDIRLSDLLVDDVVFVNNLVHFDVKLTASGFAGEQAEVVLKQQGKPEVLARSEVVIPREGQSQQVRLAYRPTEIGTFEYIVEVVPQQNESDLNNNRITRRVEVRNEKIRVLLVQSAPSFEFHYLYTLLGRQIKRQENVQEQTIELTTVWQEADQEFADANPTVQRVFPVGRDELFQFDVIVFGDVDPADLGSLEMNNLADFVKVRGGGVVFIAGPRFTPLAYRDTPLADLFPIDLASATLPLEDGLTEGFRVQPTRLGAAAAQTQLGDTPEESAEIWQQLEEIYWLLHAPDLRTAARVLAEHPTRTGSTGRPLPVICIQFVGAGTVVFHATDETHRWRFRMGDRYFSRYWIQTIRYLARAKLLGKSRQAQMTSERREYRRGEAVHLRVQFFDETLAPAQDDGVTIVLEREQGTRRHVKLHRDAANRGIFQGALTNMAEGAYRGWLATPTLEGNPPAVNFTVVAPPGELARQELDAADLKLAARISQGKFYTIREAGRLRRDLPPGRQERIGSLPPLSIWSWRPMETGILKNVPLIALAFGLLFVALIVVEWLLRKKLGML